MFGIFSKSETSPYPRCPRHAHHTVTVRDWLHLYLYCSITIPLMTIVSNGLKIIRPSRRKVALGRNSPSVDCQPLDMTIIAEYYNIYKIQSSMVINKELGTSQPF